MIRFKSKGDFSKTYRLLNKAKKLDLEKTFKRYGDMGVTALAAATPRDTGKTAESWYYNIVRTNSYITIQFLNSNVNNNVQIAVILQYGHATRNGSWVEGRDYITPALQPVFDRIAKDAWEEVVKA